jgi:hypothetical protein
VTVHLRPPRIPHRLSWIETKLPRGDAGDSPPEPWQSQIIRDRLLCRQIKNYLDRCTQHFSNQVKNVKKKTQGRCKQFLLCSINYPDMFRLQNAIFRGLHFSFIRCSSFLVCVSGGCGLLFTRCGHLLRNASQYVHP